MIFKNTQKGQALVLIALAAVGLFAFAALAIDGSIVFSDRRHAQNAADTAAYAAALARVRDSNPGLGLWKQAGINRAITNGYDASDGVTEVKVYTCVEWRDIAPENPTHEACKGLPAGADPEEYVYVRIKSVVKMYFARVIGRQEVINYTDAVVHAAPIDITEWFDGMALVAANPTCAGPGEFGPFEIGGSSDTVVINSGVFVNALCPLAFVDRGGGDLTTDEGVCVYGGVDPGVSGVNPPPEAGCGEQIDITQYWMPDSDPALEAYCEANSRDSSDITPSGGGYVATPGTYSGRPFPYPGPGNPPGPVKLQKGIYCLDAGLDLNAHWDLTTDLNGNGLHDPATEGVFFYVRDGNVSFNGASDVFLYAMSDPAGGWPSQFLDYLFYIPASNRAEVQISGGNDSTFTGMILAPTSAVDILGNGEALHLYTQIIAYNTRITGNGTIDITYDPNALPPAIIMPQISPTK